MATNECIPYYEPGNAVTVKAGAALTGKRFCRVSADRTGPELNTSTGGGNIVVNKPSAGGQVFGVMAFDVASGGIGYVVRGSGFIVPVTAAAALSAGDEVMVDAEGRVVPFASGGGVKATLATGVVGSNNAISWTAKQAGAGGNDITVTIVDPPGNNASLTVDVDNGTDIIVSSATDGSSVMTSTAAQVIAAVLEHDAASMLVDVANTGASNGSGVVAAVSETPLAGGAGSSGSVAVGLAVQDAAQDTDAQIALYR